jgi:hypothetical protein
MTGTPTAYERHSDRPIPEMETTFNAPAWCNGLHFRLCGGVTDGGGGLGARQGEAPTSNVHSRVSADVVLQRRHGGCAR